MGDGVSIVGFAGDPFAVRRDVDGVRSGWKDVGRGLGYCRGSPGGVVEYEFPRLGDGPSGDCWVVGRVEAEAGVAK